MNFDLTPLLNCLNKANSQLEIDKCNTLYRANINLFEKLPFDILFYMLLFLDNETIARLCKVSFKLNELICKGTPKSDRLWKQVIHKKYGLGFDDYSKRKNVYAKFRQKLQSISPEDGMKIAAESGDLHLVKFFIDKGVRDWNEGMEGAAFNGHMEIVKFFIDIAEKKHRMNADQMILRLHK